MRSPLVLMAAVFLAASCRSPSAPEGPPAATGVVVARDVATSFSGPPSIHVKNDPDDECGTIFAIGRATTVIRRKADGGVSLANIDELTVGTAVRVWADIVLESCPGQSAAKSVEIVS